MILTVLILYPAPSKIYTAKKKKNEQTTTNKTKCFADIMERTKMKSNFVFSDVLADNGRLTLTGDVIAAFGKMMSAHRGEVLCAVTTAQVQTAGHT